MFSKKIVPDFTPRRPFVKTKEAATAPVPDINLPTRILISESQKELPKAAPQFIPHTTRQEYVSMTSPLITPRFIQGTPLTHAPVFDPTPIPGGNVSYSPSMETFASIGESYFKLTSDISGNASQWSLYPALDSVQMNTRSLINVGGITGLLCQMNTVQALQGMITPNILTSTITVNAGAINMINNTGAHVLQAIGGNLYFDTELLASASSIQNIADWSLYPALSSVHMQNELILGSSGGYIDLTNSSWNTMTPNANLLLNPGNYVQIGGDDQPNSSLFVNNIAGIGLANGTVGQFLSHNANTIEWVAAPTTSNWSQYPAISTINAASYDIANVSTINGMPFPPPASGVASVNGQSGAVTLTGDVSTITSVTVGATTTFGAPTLGESTDLYPLQGTAWGKANYASASAASAALAAGGAATAAATAQASANAAGVTAASALATATTALAQSGITSVNGGSFAATIAAGSGIGVATTFSSGTTNPTVTISATGTAGVASLNALSGALNLVAGTNTSVVSSGGNTLTINNTAAAGVATLNTLAGALTLAAGTGISVTPSGGNTLTVANTLPMIPIWLAGGTYANPGVTFTASTNVLVRYASITITSATAKVMIFATFEATTTAVGTVFLTIARSAAIPTAANSTNLSNGTSALTNALNGNGLSMWGLAGNTSRLTANANVVDTPGVGTWYYSIWGYDTASITSTTSELANLTILQILP